ncbi:translocation/assembly module TamB domain-containing protein [Desulfospira joergensenii]|uniref:translocation/assembly module TamB domain-containing protein n=1 Tax=Desulfospira joergensenii TaxID=53329 RepID=UPI0003B32298|nr:translocation/assembly module TamB domain-containing protein [Desulfospira joergensenii]
MSRQVKLILTAAGLLTGILIALLWGLAVFFDSPAGQRLITEQVNRHIPGRISVESVDINFLQSRLSLTGLDLYGPGEKRLARVNKIEITLSWHRLLTGQIHILAAEMDSPALDITSAPDGTLDLVAALTDGTPSNGSVGPSFPVNLSVDACTLTNGRLTLALPAEDIQANLSGIDIQINEFNLNRGAATLAVDIRQGNLERADQVFPLEPFRFQARLAKDTLSRIFASAAVSGMDVSLTGQISDLSSTPVTDLEIRSHIDISKAADLAARVLPGLPDFLHPLNRQGPRGRMDLEIALKGSLENPEVRLKMDSEKIEAQGHKIDDIRLECRLSDGNLLLGPATATTRAGRLALDGRLDLSRVLPKGIGAVCPEQLGYDLVLSFPGLDLGMAASAGAGIRGRAGGRIRLRGTGISLADLDAGIKADLDLEGLQAPGLAMPVDGPMAVSGRVRGRILDLDQVSVKVAGGRLQGAGHLDLEAMTLDATVEALVEDIGILAPVADVRGAGRLEVDARLHGPVAGPEVRATLSGSGLSVRGILLGDLNARAFLDRSGRVALEQAQLSAQDFRLTARGWMDLSRTLPDGSMDFPLEIQTRLENADLNDLFPETGLQGRVNGEVSVHGTFAAPLAKARIRAGDLYYLPGKEQTGAADAGESRGSADQIRMGNLDLAADWQKNTLTLSRVFLVIGKSTISGKGDLRFPGAGDKTSPETEPAINLKLAGTDIRVQDFWPGSAGSLSLDTRITGSLNRPLGRLHLEGEDILAQGRTIHKVVVDMGFTPDQVSLDRARIFTGPGGSLDLRGKVFLADKGLDLGLTAQAFDLSQIWPYESIPLEGVADWDFDIRGTWENPLVKGRLAALDLSVRGQALLALDLSLGIKDQRITFKGDAGPRIQGSYDRVSGLLAIDLSAGALELSPYFSLAGLEGFSGKLTGKIQARGPITSPEQIRASAEVAQLAVFMDEKEVASMENGSASAENGSFRLLPATVVLGKSGRLHVEGRGGFKQRLDMKVSGEIPLEIISLWTDTVTDPSGTVQVEGSVTGPFFHPAVRADLRFQDLAMTLANVEQRLQNIRGHIRLDPQTLKVEQVRGSLGKGSFDLGGRVEFAGQTIQDMDLSLALQQMPVAVPETMDLSLNSDLKLTGAGTGLRLKGQVVLLEGLYYRDVDLNLVAAAIRRTRKVEPVDSHSLPDFLKTIALEVQILRRQPMTVENNLADLTISPDLILGGTAGAPVLSGRAQVETGVIRYNRAEFEVKKGVIDFIDPYRIEPRIDIEGQTQIRDWLITLAVSGTLDDLNLEFSSDPSEAHADILSLIAFNKTTRELRLSDGGGRPAPEEILASLMSDTLGKNIKEAMGLDVFEVRTGEDTGDSASRVNVTLGAELSREISIRYGVDIKDGKPVQRVNTTYRLLENFLMNGYQDTDGTFGGGFTYRLEFR